MKVLRCRTGYVDHVLRTDERTYCGLEVMRNDRVFFAWQRKANGPKTWCQRCREAVKELIRR